MTKDPMAAEPVTIVIGARRFDGVVLPSLCTGEVRVLTRDTVWVVPARCVERRSVAR